MIAVSAFCGMLVTFAGGFILGRMERKAKEPEGPSLGPRPDVRFGEFSPTLKADLERLRTKIDRREANRRPRGARGRFLKKSQS